jgi:para-aminobenzoate synthetase/4-amino-4-deoxychorismate lyase
LLVLNGDPVHARDHVERLAASTNAVFGVRLEIDDVMETVAVSTEGLEGRHRLRLMVSAAGDLTLATEPVTPYADKPRPLAPALVAGGLGPHKWQDRRVLDRLLPTTSGPDTEALLVDADGTLLETARANLFLVLDDGVHTPRTDGRILPGVTRASVLDLLERNRIPVRERDIGLGELPLASEVFTTSAVRGVAPVISCSDVTTWPEGPTTAWLRSALERECQPGRHVGAPHATPADRTDTDARYARVLLIDNYDSFTYNLAQYAEELGASVTVIRNDERDPADIVRAAESGDITHLVISPGPGRPEDAGISVDVVRLLAGRIPVLGVCLGHQCIATAYGARVTRSDVPVHGKQALVHHDGNGLFRGIDGPFVAARYHSLVVRDLSDDLELSAWTVDGTVMGIRHRKHPVEGIQVHPESILTPRGKALLRNFLANRRREGQFSNL